MRPEVLAAALKTAEAQESAIEAIARTKTGTPLELDARILADAANRITGNLRKLLETTERRTP